MDDEEEGGDGEAISNGHRASKKAKRGAIEGVLTKKANLKNPAVDTSFLPDREREEADRLAREELRQTWLRQQEEMKKEVIEITYSYWDGSGHRSSVTVGSWILAPHRRLR